MTRLLIATLLGATAASVTAWQLGGALGNGCLTGFFFGAAISGLGVLVQRHVLLTRPDKIMHAVAATFLVKLAALVVGGIAFRYIPEAAARADWRSFLVAFAGAAALLVPIGALDAARAYQRSIVEGNKA